MIRPFIVLAVVGLLVSVFGQLSDGLGVLVVNGSTSPDIHQELELPNLDVTNLASISLVTSNVKEPVSKDQVINIGPDLPPPGIENIYEANNRFTHFLDVVSVGEDIPTDHIDAGSYFRDEPKSVGKVMDADNPERRYSNDDPINIGPDLNVEAPIVDHKISEPISIGQHLPIPQY